MKVFLFSLFICIFSKVSSQESVTVYFDFNKYFLTPEAKASLDSFVLMANSSMPEQQLELHGHCDFRGSDDFNQSLSENRVYVVKNYLETKGIGANRFVIIEGHGERKPLNENLSEEDRQQNRRVEIKWLKTSGKELSIKEKIKAGGTSGGTNIVLKNINFVGGRSIILPESEKELQELLDAMNSYPGLMIQIEGHICCIPGPGDGLDLGTDLSNLSEARAKAIRDWLINSGIARYRIAFVGFGHSKPLYPFPERNDAEQTANRRVEIRIIKK